MVAKGVFVALAFLALVERGLSGTCVPCVSSCGPAPTCSYGLVRGVCGCCERCAKGPGEECGGFMSFSGRCSVGYKCEVPTDDNFFDSGICVAKKVTTPIVPATTEFETTPIVPTAEESVTTFPWTCGKYAWQKCAGYPTQQPPPLPVKPTLHKCHLGVCGENADCVIKGNNINCVCPPGLTGNPTIKCHTIRDIGNTALPPIGESGVSVVDSPVIPGKGLTSPGLPPLRLTTHRPLYTPTRNPPPLPTPVFAIACQNNDECPFDNPCVNKLCIDSCNQGICGENADCRTTDPRLRPVCHCPPGTTGNPAVKCSTLLNGYS